MLAIERSCHNMMAFVWSFTYKQLSISVLYYRSISCLSSACFQYLEENDARCYKSHGKSRHIRFYCNSKPQRPAGGGRFLTDARKTFEFNNWDNVEWDEEQERNAQEKVQKNSSTPVDPELRDKYDTEADKYWDKFYGQHQNRFFKDRHWLFTEFPELCLDVSRDKTHQPAESHANTHPASDEMNTKGVTTPCPVDDGTKSSRTADETLQSSPTSGEAQCTDFPGQFAKTRILEVGCGVGNTVFPILQTTNTAELFVYCCDFSPTAINLVKEHTDYDSSRCHAFVCDVTDQSAKWPFPEASLDVVVLIFVLSAIKPDKMPDFIKRLARFLKPGGLIVFRDYGRYDLAQLRFKDGKCLSDNFYVRGDGTQVYFFTQEELRELFTGAGLIEEQNLIDRRLQVNRGRQLKMYRVWVQCKYRKPRES